MSDTVSHDHEVDVLKPVELSGEIPRHVAIIMDGNGRWAKAQKKLRIIGHRRGVETVREVVKACRELKIEVLTLFAFSSENWRRPAKEVSLLMDLFFTALDREVKRLHRNNIQLRIIGDHSAFPERIQKRIIKAQVLTANNDGMILNVAANYGGKWDIIQAAQKLAAKAARGEIEAESISDKMISAELSMSELPDPDLFIRTGGEERISNFLIWQLAYTELYFTDTLWPAFDRGEFNKALSSFSGRQRRFGHTGEQIEKLRNA
ncbi:Undecaprenyl diphosphate synthase [hydrothermal vent metagenome]|uniref:Undecaprenyl diphosphate synthase n=1 Tax=hydrothermal vent metagenome TaxID=652676 RepID=A0A3B1AXU2_9ZZZZ